MGIPFSVFPIMMTMTPVHLAKQLAPDICYLRAQLKPLNLIHEGEQQHLLTKGLALEQQ